MINPNDFRNIVILTGAGISAESGINTFRDSGGLWEKHRIEEVATPEAFAQNPELVWRFYSIRRVQAAKASPNPAHRSLVEYAQKFPGRVTLITQNVDVLHQRADQKSYLPPLCMHGSLHQSRCHQCGQVYLDDHAYFKEDGSFHPQATDLLSATQKASSEYLHHRPLQYAGSLPLTPCCGKMLRPHIVWFGEMPLFMDEIEKHLERCDLFMSVGTSGQVYPAAGFLQAAKESGATTICLNRDPLPTRAWIDQFIEGKAGEELPRFFGMK